MKKTIGLLACAILAATITTQGQTTVKKGPPDLSGTWVLKENGVTTRHYTATQTGNDVTLVCKEKPDKVLQFSWDEPGNYTLAGTMAGVQFDETTVTRTVKAYFRKEVSTLQYKTQLASGGWMTGSVEAIFAKQYDADLNTVPIINFSDVLTCRLCQNNNFILQARFSVSQKLDEIAIAIKSVWILIPRPSIRYDYSKGDGIYERKCYKAVSSGECCTITYDTDYKYMYTLTKVKDSW